MGGWKLEVFRMAIYMSFPVGCYYVFNKPEYFEKWMVKIRREYYPPEERMHAKEVEEVVRLYKKRREDEMQKELESTFKH